jgi:ribosomal protein S13
MLIQITSKHGAKFLLNTDLISMVMPLELTSMIYINNKDFPEQKIEVQESINNIIALQNNAVRGIAISYRIQENERTKEFTEVDVERIIDSYKKNANINIEDIKTIA